MAHKFKHDWFVRCEKVAQMIPLVHIALTHLYVCWRDV